MKLLIVTFSLSLVISSESKNLTPRILNGTSVTSQQSELQHIVAIESCNNKNVCNICSGIVIAKQLVLTAAHCFQPESGQTININKIKAKIGILKNNNVVTDTRSINVRAIKLHNNFRHRKISAPFYTINAYNAFDIAVVQLDQCLNLQHSEIVDLATSNPDENSTATVSGWGATDVFNLVDSDRLRFAEVQIIPDYECDSHLGYNITQKRQFCTIADFKGACVKDSGAPLIRYIDNQRSLLKIPQVIGVFSYTEPWPPADGVNRTLCGISPDVYVSVSENLAFIKGAFQFNGNKNFCQ